MEKASRKKAPYAKWHKTVLIGCVVIALLGTIGVIGAMAKLAGTVSDYGGNLGVAFYVAIIMMLLSMWLFAGSGALLVYIAKTNRDIAGMLETSLPAEVE